MKQNDNAPTAPSCNKHLVAKFVSFTLVSQLSDDQMWMVQYHCERWGDNPMSIAVFTDRTAASVKSDLVLMGCSEENLTTLQTVRKTYDAVDFWPSTKLRSILSDKKTRVRFASDPKFAAVSAFQLHQRCRDDNKYCREKNIQMMPEEKNAMMKLIGTRETSIFDPTNEASHGSTKYVAWKDQRRGRTFVDLPCIKSDRYEPFLALRFCTEFPPFQEGFTTGHGQDKTSWVMQLRRAGYLFSQIGEAFFVHYAHENRIAEVKDEADDAEEAHDAKADASEAYHSTDNSKINDETSNFEASNSSDNSDDDDSVVNTKPSRKLLQTSEMMMHAPVDTLFSDFEPWLNVVVGDESRVPLCEMALIHEEDLSAKPESREMEDEKKEDKQNAN